MKVATVIFSAVFALDLASSAQGVNPSPATGISPSRTEHLRFQSTANLRFTGSVIGRAKCDDEGNIYARLVASNAANQKVSSQPVHQISKDGAIERTFDFAGTYPDFKVIDFFATREGNVFLAARSDVEEDVYVISFTRTSQTGNAVKLETEYFVPYQIGVFKSGEYLLSGIHGDNNRTPYAAVFDSAGRLIRRIYEPEDESARDKADKGERNFRPETLEFGNDFVVHGDVALGSDGNMYLLRAGDPALIYVVSKKGEVIQKLSIPSPGPGLVARTLKSSSGRLAIGFLKSGMNQGTLVITDYAGKILSSHDGDDLRTLPGLVACYDTQGFNFMGLKDHVVQIHRAELK